MELEISNLIGFLICCASSGSHNIPFFEHEGVVLSPTDAVLSLLIRQLTSHRIMTYNRRSHGWKIVSAREAALQI